MRCIFLTALAAMPLAVFAQSEQAGAQTALRESQAEINAAGLKDANARDAVRIEASSANSQVSIKSSIILSDGKGTTDALSLIASAPLAKGADNTTLANRRGLNSGTTLTLAFTSTSLKGTRKAPDEVIDLNCTDGTRFKSAFLSTQADKSAKLVCDPGAMKELAEKRLISPSEYRDFRSAFFGPNAAVHAWSVALSGGYQDAAYFDATSLAKTTQRNSGGGVAVNYSYAPLEATQLFAAAFGFQSRYKDAKSTTACLPALATGSTLLTCANGSIGAPTRQTTQTLDLEWRRKVYERYAFSVQLSRDFKDKVTTIQVPVYLVGNDKDGLTGGVNLGWASDDKKLSVGVFVGKAFSLEP
jgi:hypothetical protein